MLSERGLDVFALLRVLLDYVPGPRSATLASPAGFAASSSRFESCPDCLANGRVRVSCETCKGRGELYVGGPDPYTRDVEAPYDPRRVSPGFGGEDRERRRADQRRNLDLERRLEDEQAVRAGLIAPSDALTAVLSARDRHFDRGSIRAVAEALEGLRGLSEASYSRCWKLAVHPPALDGPLTPALEDAIEQLAALVPDPIRLPPGVIRSRDQELEQIATNGKSALWRGRSHWAQLTRGQRDQTIIAYVQAGIPIGVTAWRFGLTRRRVQQILRQHHERHGNEAAA